MSEPSSIHVSMTWDEATFLEGAKIAYDVDMRHSWRRYAGWFFIALTQFGVVGAIRHQAIGLLLVSTLLVIYWYGLRWPLRRRMLRRFFRSHPDAGKTLEISLLKEGVCVKEGCIPWNRFLRAILSPKGYLLQLDDGTFLYLPRRIFPDSDTRNAFVAEIREKISSIVKIDT
ncbi:YcxB family protein [Hydrogenimonas urashimensis]|uniref:YcxB family protein n=1 Tax=Hydrogenimonas urashimensis TaxID=2740515 RepID=UPI001915C007|nr:YcxB family protein [Hydrogenimonas urashimensis]